MKSKSAHGVLEMHPFKLKKQDRATVFQSRPLVFRRIDDHWSLVSDDEQRRKGRFSLGNGDLEDQSEYS